MVTKSSRMPDKNVKKPDSTSSGTNSFVHLPPVPNTITESYLADMLNKMSVNLLPKLPSVWSGDDLCDRLNLLLQFYDFDMKVIPGSGEKYVRDSLAVLVEEYNKHGKK